MSWKNYVLSGEVTPDGQPIYECRLDGGIVARLTERGLANLRAWEIAIGREKPVPAAEPVPVAIDVAGQLETERKYGSALAAAVWGVCERSGYTKKFDALFEKALVTRGPNGERRSIAEIEAQLIMQYPPKAPSPTEIVDTYSAAAVGKEVAKHFANLDAVRNYMSRASVSDFERFEKERRAKQINGHRHGGTHE